MATGTTADRVHGLRPDSPLKLARTWEWRKPRRGDFFRTCSYCGSISPEDLAAEAAGAGPCQVCGLSGWEACFRSQVPAWAVHLTEQQRAILTDEERASLEGRTARHAYSPGGWWASWADRKYGWPHKFYVEGLKPRDPGMLHCISTSSHDPREGSFGTMGLQWHQVRDCPRKLLKAARADGMMYSAEKPDMWLGFGPRASLHAKFYSVHLADPLVSDEVKETISRVSGLVFEFTEDGRVGWRLWAPPEAASDPA